MANTPRCWTEIDLSVIIKNYEVYKSCLSTGVKLMAVVKADAYGHGDVEVARTLQGVGVTDFAAATIEEGIRLRKH